MRIRFLVSGIFASAVFSMSVQADILPTPEDIHNQTQSATDTIKNALPPLPDLSGAPALPSNDPAKKAAADSMSVPPPVQVSPPSTVPPASAATTTPAAPATAATTPSTAPATPGALPPIAAPGLPATPESAAVAAAKHAAETPATMALPSVDNKNADLLPPALPGQDPSLLPNPGNSASTPTLPFALPDAAKAAAQSAGSPNGASIISGDGKVTPVTDRPVVTAPNTPPAAATPVKAKGKKRHRKKIMLAKAKVPYRNIILPETISKRVYDRHNLHLPAARYESDLDALLFVAIRHDDINGVHALLDYSKRDLNKPGANGETPLIAAVNSNAFNTVRILLGRHANANATDRNGMTALQIAQQKGNTRVAHIIESATGGLEPQVAATSAATTSTNGGSQGTTTPLQLMKPTHIDVN